MHSFILFNEFLFLIFFIKEIFRKSVSLSLLEDARESLNKGITLRSYFTKKFTNVGDSEFFFLACLIKLYCSSLKEPIFTIELSKSWIILEEAVEPSDEKKLQYYRKTFIDRLPVENRFFIFSLLKFLKLVADAQTNNVDGCMGSSNLGIVFAPSTMYDPKDPTYGVSTAPIIFSKLIDNIDSFSCFAEEDLKGNLASMAHQRHSVSGVKIQVPDEEINPRNSSGSLQVPKSSGWIAPISPTKKRKSLILQ